MTALAFLLLGIGVVALEPPDPTRRRLRWLASARLGASEAALGYHDSGVPTSAMAAMADPHRLIRSALHRPGLCAVLLAVPCGVLAGPVPAALAAAAAFVLVRCARVLAGDRAGEQARIELLAAVTALSGEYAAGATVAGAFGAAAPGAGRHAVALASASALASQGLTVSTALTGEPMLAPLAVACAAAHRSGSSLTDVLAGVAADVAADRDTRRAVQASLTGPRTSAVLLAGLPVIGLSMGAAMGAHPARVLLHTALGLAALTAGVALEVVGLVWTMVLTRRALP